MIVLNENMWAKEMIDAKSMGKKPFETIVRVARYYIDSGYKKIEVRKKLDAFLLSCDPYASLCKWSDTLDSAIKKATKYEAINIEHIDITQPELDRILTLKSIMAKRLAFTLLVLSKYWRIARGIDNWVNNEDSEIMKMANIKTSIKTQSDLYRQLRDAGLIEFSRRIDNTNVHVLFEEEGEVVMSITDLRNLGFQYLAFYNKKDFYICQNCGVICKKQKQRGRNPKYCSDCAVKIHLQQRVNSAMRIRKTKLAQSS